MARREKISEMSLRKWYSNSVSIPSYTSLNYTGFVASCLGIVRSVVQRNLNTDIRVVFSDVSTAAANQKESRIEISSNFLWGEFAPTGAKLRSDDAITLCLGLIVHEAAHFAWSPATLLPAAEYVKAHTKLPYIEMLAATIFNIVEDIYIEAEVERTVPSISWMLNYSNSLFFTEGKFKETFEKVYNWKVAPAKLDDVSELGNLLIYAKTQNALPDDKESSAYVKNLFNVALEATELHELEDRYELTLEIYELLMENIKQDAEEEGDHKSGSCEGEEGEPSEGESSKMSPSKGIKELAKELGKSSAYHGEDEEVKPRKGLNLLDSGERGRTRKVNEMVAEDDNTDYSFERIEGDGKVADVESSFVEKRLKPALTPLAMDKRYVRLGEIARQRASVNRPYGLDQKRGNNIRKLYRIATDQKIFAQSQPMSNYQPMEVIILVDCSGSMDQNVRGERGSYVRRIDLACEAGLGAAYGLNEGRCLVAVYGHTADITDKETVIYTAKTFRDPMTNLAEKMETMRNSYTCQNRDGFAIQYVGRKFNRDSRRRRLLIVISDGQPQANNYSGHDGIIHTRSSVDALRKQGIDVLSISITHESLYYNNMIYGETNNVFNEDPRVIDEVVKNLVLGV